MRPKTIPNPYACANCGIDRDKHGRQYGGCAGNVWVAPSSELVKARMRARRNLNRGGA